MQLSIAAFIAIIGCTAAKISQKDTERLISFKEECSKSLPDMDETMIENALEGIIPDDDLFAEFLKCFGEKLKFLNADGTFNVEQIIKIAKRTGHDFTEVINKCTADDQGDGGKNAVHLAKCLHENVTKEELQAKRKAAL